MSLLSRKRDTDRGSARIKMLRNDPKHMHAVALSGPPEGPDGVPRRLWVQDEDDNWEEAFSQEDADKKRKANPKDAWVVVQAANWEPEQGKKIGDKGDKEGADTGRHFSTEEIRTIIPDFDPTLPKVPYHGQDKRGGIAPPGGTARARWSATWTSLPKSPRRSGEGC